MPSEVRRFDRADWFQAWRVHEKTSLKGIRGSCRNTRQHQKLKAKSQELTAKSQ